MSWHWELTAKSERDMQRLDRAVRERVIDALDRLVGDPPQGDVKHLQGRPEWRLRVGDWRVIFGRNPATKLLTVIAVRHRGEAYR